MASTFEAFDKAAAAYYESKRTYSALLREAAQRQAEAHRAKEQEASAKQEQNVPSDESPSTSEQPSDPAAKPIDSDTTTQVEDKLKKVDLKGSKGNDLPDVPVEDVSWAEMKATSIAIAEAKAKKSKGKGKVAGKGR